MRFPQQHRDHDGTLKVPHGLESGQLSGMRMHHHAGVTENGTFYFAHSYFAVPAQNALVAGRFHSRSGLRCRSAGQHFCGLVPPEKRAEGFAGAQGISTWNGTV